MGAGTIVENSAPSELLAKHGGKVSLDVYQGGDYQKSVIVFHYT